MNRFIRQSRYVKSLLSWPTNESWWLCFVKRSDCTHAARPAARVEHDALFGLEHRDERLDNGDGREVLAATLPLARCELADEVLVDAADQVVATVIRFEDVLAKQIDRPRTLTASRFDPA